MLLRSSGYRGNNTGPSPPNTNGPPARRSHTNGGWLAYSAIRAGDFGRHQAWMAFNFGLVLTTPFLRIFWVFFGWTLPGLTQAENNMGITTFLLPFCLMLGLSWLAVQRGRVVTGTAATGAFATHFFVAHYFIFEVLERRSPDAPQPA